MISEEGTAASLPELTRGQAVLRKAAAEGASASGTPLLKDGGGAGVGSAVRTEESWAAELDSEELDQRGDAAVVFPLSDSACGSCRLTHVGAST